MGLWGAEAQLGPDHGRFASWSSGGGGAACLGLHFSICRERMISTPWQAGRVRGGRVPGSLRAAGGREGGLLALWWRLLKLGPWGSSQSRALASPSSLGALNVQASSWSRREHSACSCARLSALVCSSGLHVDAPGLLRAACSPDPMPVSRGACQWIPTDTCHCDTMRKRCSLVETWFPPGRERARRKTSHLAAGAGPGSACIAMMTPGAPC